MSVVSNRRAAVIAIALVVTLVLGPGHAMMLPSHAAAPDDSVCPPPGAVPGDVFADDDGNVHEPAINCAAQYDLVGGFGWGGYGPGRSMTRAQMSSMLVRFLDVSGADLPAASNAPDAFDDDSGSVHEFNINVLAALGVVKGAGGRRFGPDQPVDRAQMTSFVVQALQEASGTTVPDGPDGFDDDTSSVHERSINALTAAGVVRGVAPRRFAPDAEVTRAQTASFVIGAAQLLAQQGAWAPTHTASVALDARQVTAGAAVTGTVMAARMVGAHVSGCGLQREPLHDADAGAAGLQFSAVVPSSQAEGDCVLTFVVAFTDARSHAIDETISVAPAPTAATAPPPADGGAADGSDDSTQGGSEDSTQGGNGGDTPPPTVAGPVLRSCSRTGQRSSENPDLELVVFTFDRDVTTVQEPTPPTPTDPALPPSLTGLYAPPKASGFHVYRFDGTNYNAATTTASGAQVTAEFPAEQLHNTSLCTVDAQVVRDEAGAMNPIGDASLPPMDQPARVTAAPDLEEVGNLRVDVTGFVYADFRFDEQVVNDPSPERFKLIMTSGSEHRGVALYMATDPPGQEPFAPPASVISVRFGATQQGLPFSQVVRGIAQENTVCDGTSRCNTLQTAAMRSETTTSAPDLISARVLNDVEVEFTFDEPLAIEQPSELSTNSPRFGIYDGAGRWDLTSVVQAHSDPRVVTASFGGAPATVPASRGDGAATGEDPVNVATTAAIGAFVFEGSVRQTTYPNIDRANRDDQVALPPVDFAPGRTVGPDLTAVTVITDPVSQARVVRYTFDASVAALVDGAPAVLADGSSRADDFGCRDFWLYDETGGATSAVRPDEECTTGPAGSTATIRAVAGDDSSVDVHGSPAAAADGAVLAAVNDARFETYYTDALGDVKSIGNPQEGVMRFPEGAEVLTRG